MPTLPLVNVPTIKSKTRVYKTYKIDFDNNRVAGKVDKLEALIQFIDKALRTERFYYKVYTAQYGHEIDALYQKNISKEFFGVEVERLIKEAIEYDSRINNVDNFSFKFIEDGLHVNFTVYSIYGTFEKDGVITA